MSDITPTPEPTYVIALTTAELEALRGAVEYSARDQYGSDADLAAFEVLLERTATIEPMTADRIGKAIHDGPSASIELAGAMIAPHPWERCPHQATYLGDGAAVLAALR